MPGEEMSQDGKRIADSTGDRTPPLLIFPCFEKEKAIMAKTLVLTFIADDRPGLVNRLSEIVSGAGGNWLESRMAHLAEKFAGIVMVDIPAGKIAGLKKALEVLEDEGFHLTVEETSTEVAAAGPIYNLDLVGPDQTGILHEITNCLAEHGVSVEDMDTDIRDAPMSGGVMFYANAHVRLPKNLNAGELQAALEALAGSLMVDITLRKGN
jgi:glycine cleavage system regulatory protein